MTEQEKALNRFTLNFIEIHGENPELKDIWQGATAEANKRIVKLESENAIMREALNKIALGHVYDADIIESAGDCLQRISATPAESLQALKEVK